MCAAKEEERNDQEIIRQEEENTKPKADMKTHRKAEEVVERARHEDTHRADQEGRDMKEERLEQEHCGYIVMHSHCIVMHRQLVRAVGHDNGTNGHADVSSPQQCRSDSVPKQQAMPGTQKHDLSIWKYSELQNAINTSRDSELLEACLHECHRRLKAYNAWKAEKAHKNTLQQDRASQSVIDDVKSMNMDMDLNHSHPTTAPPPYPGPPDSSRQPFVSNNPGPHSSYTTYPNQASVTVVHSPPLVSGVQHIVITNNMGPNSAPYTCKSCNLQIITRTERKSTLRTHLCAGLLCILALWPCVIIPYCMDSCNNIDHYCPNCSAYVGTYMA